MSLKSNSFIFCSGELASFININNKDITVIVLLGKNDNSICYSEKLWFKDYLWNITISISILLRNI
jgi:hypothetical protein